MADYQCSAEVKHLCKVVEEEVTLLINGFCIDGFAWDYPRNILVGRHYLVSVQAQIFDQYQLKAATSPGIDVQKVTKNGFAYWVTGKLQDGVLMSFIDIIDEVLLSDYSYLDGQYVRMKIDRFDIEFLPH